MIERTFDYRKIKKIVSWQPIISDKFIYLIDEGYGLWVFHDYINGFMIHVEMADNCRGKEAIKRGCKALKWVFKNTTAIIVYAFIPKIDKHVCQYARGLGMTFTHEKNNMRHFKINKVNDYAVSAC